MPRVHAKSVIAPGIELTPKQRAFVAAIVKNGCSATKAAEMAGYAVARQAAYDLQHLPHVAAAIRLERERYISGELANVAIGTLREVMTDKAASPAARVQAARTVLELSGDLGKARKDGEAERPLSELSAEELTRLIDRWTEERAAMAKQLEPSEVEVLDGTAQLAGLTPADPPADPVERIE